MVYRTLDMVSDFPTVLTASRTGDGEALSRAFQTAYDELRRLARGQLRRLRPGQTLTTTSLVHEAYMKLVDRPVETVDRAHFFALAARAMRQILVDYARQRFALKRGGERRPVTLDTSEIPVETLAEEMLGIDRALSRLESLDERLARVVEWRFFGGMTEEEVGEALGVTTRTVRRDWQKARAFLYRELQGAGPD
jgi:RNA polymerase sigma factor (TIGR02999 family)